MQIVTTTDDLTKLSKALAKDPYITIDTEFIRDSTYWPQLCLIQVAGNEHEAIIDPLADGIDLKPFIKLLLNEKVLKVFHAARQDLEIFFHMTGKVPHPIFDTQVAAAVCGYGDQVGYETLVRKICDEQVDKSSRFTDWSRRPLTKKQLTYALGDVTHLRVIYEKLEKRLGKAGREHWLAEEMATLTSPATYTLHPEDAWKRLKIRTGNRRFIAILREIATWRETEAQTRNVPRNRILKDDAILEIASHAPASFDDLNGLRGVPKGFGKSAAGKTLLKAIEKGAKADTSDIEPAARKDHLPHGVGPMMELLKVLLKAKSEEHEVASRMIATTSDLEKIAATDDEDIPALKGWRREVFGEDALRLKRGEIGLAVRKKRVAAVPLAPSDKAGK